MYRVGFIGVPSTGKSVLAKLCAAHSGEYSKFDIVEYVPEYARAYINKYGLDGLHDQVRIMNKQKAEEDKQPETTQVLYCDSPLFLVFTYALELRTNKEKDTMLLNDIFKDLNKLNSPPRYDIVFHLPPVLAAVNDGTRALHQLNDDWRKEMDEKIVSTFRIFKPANLITINSLTRMERVAECFSHINRLLK